MAISRQEKLEDVVSEHAVTLGILVKSFNHIEAYMKESVEIQKEQAVIFERMANHEEKNTEEHAHIHNRIDKLEGRCDDIEDTHQLKCDLLTPKIDNGEKAYKALMWVMTTVGALALATIYKVIWGDK